jgi:hypothetical protein
LASKGALEGVAPMFERRGIGEGETRSGSNLGRIGELGTS